MLIEKSFSNGILLAGDMLQLCSIFPQITAHIIQMLKILNEINTGLFMSTALSLAM